MQCPFLTRLSSNYVRNYGASLLKNYANQCPVASRLISNMANAETSTEGTCFIILIYHNTGSKCCQLFVCAVGKCPFMANASLVKEASKEMQEDIIDLSPSINKKGKHLLYLIWLNYVAQIILKLIINLIKIFFIF